MKSFSAYLVSGIYGLARLWESTELLPVARRCLFSSLREVSEPLSHRLDVCSAGAGPLCCFQLWDLMRKSHSCTCLLEDTWTYFCWVNIRQKNCHLIGTNELFGFRRHRESFSEVVLPIYTPLPATQQSSCSRSSWTLGACVCVSVHVCMRVCVI